MGKVVSIHGDSTRPRPEKRRTGGQDYVRGQQVLANAIFHWRNDPAEDARAAVRLLMHHLATQFRADDEPPHPRPVHEDSRSPA